MPTDRTTSREEKVYICMSMCLGGTSTSEVRIDTTMQKNFMLKGDVV